MNFPPRLKYVISTGELFEDDVLVCHGYSGVPEHRNDPRACDLHDQGPIPPGWYLISPARFSQRTGPLTMSLSQVSGTSYGREGFALHGDNRDHTASHGCIVLSKIVRSGIAAYVALFPRLRLEVVA